jgi:hypothetical protein
MMVLSIKLLPLPSMKLTPLSMEYCQVSPASKLLTVIMFISPTIVNIEKDATESEIVYTAVTNENKVTYTLKSDFQKEKFCCHFIGINSIIITNTIPSN